MKTFRGREGGEEPVDNFSYFSGGGGGTPYRYQSSLLYLLNPVGDIPRGIFLITLETKMATCYRMCLIPMILRKNRGL